jgi:hypothetical protein
MSAVRFGALVTLLSALASLAAIQNAWARKSPTEFRPANPKTWDDAAIPTLEAR